MRPGDQTNREQPCPGCCQPTLSALTVQPVLLVEGAKAAGGAAACSDRQAGITAAGQRHIASQLRARPL